MTKRKKRPGGNPARAGLSFSARGVVREFERWMSASEYSFTDPTTSRVGFEHLIALTSHAGFDVFDPDDAETIVDALLDLALESDDDDSLDLFHDYVHFQLETGPEGRWEGAHEYLEEMLDVEDPIPDVIAVAMEEEAQLDPDERRAALAEVLVVARVRELLDWIGPGRTVTGSGALRRGDIGPVAALLGLSARGVAKLPTRTGEYRDGAIVVRGEAHVQSMWQLPQLTAWWDALITMELIEVSRTRVRPGPGASAWRVDESPPLDDASAVASIFVSNVLTSGLQREWDGWNATIVRLNLTHAVAALDPDAVADAAEPRSAMDELLLPRAVRTLEHLAHAGLVVDEGPGRFRVPELLRGTFARGIAIAMSVAAEMLIDDDDTLAADDSNPFDDPGVKAEMARLGIVHTPGLAAETLSELAPLLAEEGIDLDNLDGDDLESVNAALARATERRNLELFTPVGERRAMALTVHRLVAEAIAEQSVDLARIIMDGIAPEPAGNFPSVAQVIGVGLGALDEWHTDSDFAPVLARAKVPTWDRPAVDAARDILRAARRGEAFDHLRDLHLRNRGKLVLEGTLLAVAGSVIALAEHEGVDVRELAGRVLVEA